MNRVKSLIAGIGLCLCTGLIHPLSAQVEPASIFEVGKEIKCCEDNFYNLFRNWEKRNIRNADSIRLLTYEYLGTVKDRSMVRMYADLMSGWDYPLPEVTSGRATYIDSTRQEVEESFYELNLGVLLSQLEYCREAGIQEELYMREFLKGRMERRQANRHAIPIGAKVYKLYMEQAGKSYAIFLFFDPETSRLTTPNLFSNIPVKYIKARNIVDGTEEEKPEKNFYWKNQLAVPMTSQDLIWEQSGLRLKGYTEKYVVETEEQLLELEEELVHEQSVLPVMQSSGKRIVLLKTIEEIQKNKDQIYDFEQLKKDLDAVLSVGVRGIELQWDYQGKEVRTLCVADDLLGVIYEPVFSHVPATPEYSVSWIQGEVGRQMKRQKMFEVKMNTLLGDELLYDKFRIEDVLNHGGGYGCSFNGERVIYMHGMQRKIEYPYQEARELIHMKKGKVDYIWYLTTGGKELSMKRQKGKYSFRADEYFPYVVTLSGQLSWEITE